MAIFRPEIPDSRERHHTASAMFPIRGRLVRLATSPRTAASGHIEGAIWLSLDDFKDSIPEVDHQVPIAVLCKGGYRSLIACSLLQRAGFRNVANVIGGFSAWEKAQLPFVTESAIAV